MALLRERGIVLEVCPSSNLNTRVVRDLTELRQILRRLLDHEVPFTFSTDGPEMLRSYLRDEIALVLRNEMMSIEEMQRAIETAHRASFIDPAPPLEATRQDLAQGNGQATIALEVEV